MLGIFGMLLAVLGAFLLISVVGCIDYDTDWCCLSKKKAGQGADCHSWMHR